MVCEVLFCFVFVWVLVQVYVFVNEECNEWSGECVWNAMSGECREGKGSGFQLGVEVK